MLVGGWWSAAAAAVVRPTRGHDGLRDASREIRQYSGRRRSAWAVQEFSGGE